MPSEKGVVTVCTVRKEYVKSRMWMWMMCTSRPCAAEVLSGSQILQSA